MKRLSLTLLLLFAALSGWAQNKFIEFEHTTHDFGVLKEEIGNADHVYGFKNTTDSPIKLIHVKASCGCTTPTWTKEVIMPGATGEVKASYGTKNRPGDFSKTITVKAAKADAAGAVKDSATFDIKILTIKGNVTARTKGVEDWYPHKDGSIRFSTNHVNYGKISTKDKPSKDVVIYNEGTEPITIENVEAKPYITYDFKNGKTVNPKDSLKFTVAYDAEKVADFDFIHDKCTLKTNDKAMNDKGEPTAVKQMYVGSTIEPFVGEMTPEQKASAAKIVFEKETHDFGTITEGESVKTEFIFKNEGKSNLQILKTKATCGCTASEPDKKLLKPGETSKINVTFNSTGKKGVTSKQITVVTNDPEKPSIKLTIKSDIKEKAGAAPVAPAGK